MARGAMAKGQQRNDPRRKEKQEREKQERRAKQEREKQDRRAAVLNTPAKAALARRRGMVSGAGLAALITVLIAAARMDEPEAARAPERVVHGRGGAECADRVGDCMASASSARCIENATLRELCCDTCHHLATHAGAAPKRDPYSRTIPSGSI
eukprot:7275909-Prymnesium_polylepis.1